MVIKFNCVKCNHGYTVEDSLAGKMSKCRCGHNMVVPEIGVNPSSEDIVTDFYFRKGDTVIGPISGVELREAAFNNQVGPDTLIANDANGPWFIASLANGLFDKDGNVLPHPSESQHLVDRTLPKSGSVTATQQAPVTDSLQAAPVETNNPPAVSSGVVSGSQVPASAPLTNLQNQPLQNQPLQNQPLQNQPLATPFSDGNIPLPNPGLMSNPTLVSPAYQANLNSQDAGSKPNRRKLIVFAVGGLGVAVCLVTLCGIYLFFGTQNSASDLDTANGQIAANTNESSNNTPPEESSDEIASWNTEDSSVVNSDSSDSEISNPDSINNSEDPVDPEGMTPPVSADGDSPATPLDMPDNSLPAPVPEPVVATDVYASIEKLSLPLPPFVGTEYGENRTWSSVSGDFTVDGVFGGVRQGEDEMEVSIGRTDDPTTVPMSSLSIEDRNWVYRNGQYDYMRHIQGEHSNITESYRRFTPDDFETPTPFDVDWVTGIPELWGPVYSVNLVADKKALRDGKYNDKYIRLTDGFLAPRENWAITQDGIGWLSGFSQGSESIVIVWNKRFVDNNLGGYTSENLFDFCVDILVDRYPDIFLAVLEEYGALGAVEFVYKVVPIFFETSITGKLVGDVLYAQSFTLNIKNTLGGNYISAKDEMGYRDIFYKELLQWLATVRARVAEGTDLNADGVIASTEHPIGYFEDIEGAGVDIGGLVNHLRSRSALSHLNKNMNKFSRMVLQFKQVDQDDDDRIRIADYEGEEFAEFLNPEFIKNAKTIKEDERAILLVLTTVGIRPKFYVAFADKFAPAMLGMSFAIRSEKLTNLDNPYKNKSPSEVTAMINSQSPTQAAFADSVLDLIKRREVNHFRMFMKPHPVAGVLQWSDLKGAQLTTSYMDQVLELDWVMAHINLMDSKLVEVVPLTIPTERLPSGAGHIYRYVGPHGSVNIWIDGILEQNYAIRGLFWDHSVSEDNSHHLWTWKENGKEQDITGELVNVQFIKDKIMLVISSVSGEIVAVPMYAMPREMRRFSRWALAILRTDKYYESIDIHERIALSVENGYAGGAGPLLAEADGKWGDRNGKASHIEITRWHYYDTIKQVQFDAKEVEESGQEVVSVRNLPESEIHRDPFLVGLISYEAGPAAISTETIYAEMTGIQD